MPNHLHCIVKSFCMTEQYYRFK